jgi:hypothetical protein
MSAVATFQVAPCPPEIPADLLALAPDTAVTALRHWFDFAIEETTNAGQLKSEIEQRVKHQAAGLFTIDEAACIAADAIGADRKQIRQLIWKAVDDGALVPLHDKAKAPLPLPLAGTNKNLALVQAHELESLFAAWPTVAVPATTSPEAVQVRTDEPIEARNDRWLAFYEAEVNAGRKTGAYQRGKEHFNLNDRSTYSKAVNRTIKQRAEKYRADIKAVPAKAGLWGFQLVIDGKKTKGMKP